MASELPNEDTYGKMLTDGLRKLELHRDASTSAAPDATHEDGAEGSKESGASGPSYAVLPSRAASSAHIREGYGFRPTSGFSTPASAVPRETDSPRPDPNGLGWPGKETQFILQDVFLLVVNLEAKSTLARLNATPSEKAAREQRLAEAVRTVLECIGEDPDREGLQRTPTRYAQALMWMTKGYEERLAGQGPMFAC